MGQLSNHASGGVMPDSSEVWATALQAWVSSQPAAPVPLKPGHRIKLKWPPHPISHKYHVLATDWRGSLTLEIHGEKLPVKVARSAGFVFGRCNDLWLEARGDDEPGMMTELKAAAEPYFRKMLSIAELIGSEGRFRGSFAELEPLQLLKLLYAEDRDIADDAQIELDKRHDHAEFGLALISILEDRHHRCRRSAQWCVLDLFEELPRYCPTPDREAAAVQAMRDLIWDAPDDYARTVFKAGVVLGGHLSETHGGPVLIECLDAPSPIGRRSAIHGLFHVAEWVPSARSQIVSALQDHAKLESEPALARFARGIAADIANDASDHIPEPQLPLD